ncbi:MAG: hypothetical protein AB1861_16595 [Cyanobacteriota bacterium]
MLSRLTPERCVADKDRGERVRDATEARSPKDGATITDYLGFFVLLSGCLGSDRS